MEKPEKLIEAGTDAMASKDWGKARRLFEEARGIILGQLKGDEEKEDLKPLLMSLEGDGTPGRPGRIAMAQDYRDRIAGLRAWITKERIQEDMSTEARRFAFQKARYELALNSLMHPMQDAALEAVETIIEGENYNESDYYKITEVVFAQIIHVLQYIDPDNEDEIVQYCMEIPVDPSFEKERRISRTNNQIAVEDRIFAHYNNVKTDLTFIKHKQKLTKVLTELASNIVSILEFR